ncbi:MAG: exodeoxyribonuclease VII large subunit, partial [Candidatus Obscuribacterales bacterium]|nr:exodeoxyribonuclease VII large subunit [Candidatus Obscuribacterales bacterium]
MYSTKPSHPLRPVLTVGELTEQIKDLLESTFDFVYVAGEISNAKVYSSGHWYFSLKDQDATLSCVAFKNANQHIKFKLEDGLMVVARGKLSVYPPRGGYQMIVTALEPVGIGEWQLAFEQLKTRLAQEGLLAPERKRPIPILPKKVGIVTSPSGAALHDILNTIKRRNSSVDLLIAPARVQGEGSAESVCQALQMLQEIDDLDVIIVARGGGSIEDLWSFNTEMVARAVLGSRVPVISGVGHETDVTICDLVADLRAPTPTAAAELVAKGYTELNEKWSFLRRHLVVAIDERVAKAQSRVAQSSPEKSLLRYQDRLRHLRERVVFSRNRITDKVSYRLSANRQLWRQYAEKLNVLGPKQVLSRGFSVIRKEDGTVVRNFDSVKPGERLEALLENGRVIVEV